MFPQSVHDHLSAMPVSLLHLILLLSTFPTLSLPVPLSPVAPLISSLQYFRILIRSIWQEDPQFAYALSVLALTIRTLMGYHLLNISVIGSQRLLHCDSLSKSLISQS